ncbi:hypothetical protein HDK90DRAFT_270284 [Phyllosticta capitalensis]|uniref:Uncharacterized protein n=1 Tax=Phyllosticta capitalensis TaxID=121624 RepID=A0ABR1YM77_9PEZI
MPNLKIASTVALFLCTVFASEDRIRHARDGSIATPWTWRNSSVSAATGSLSPSLSPDAIVSPTPSPIPLGTGIFRPAFNPVPSQVSRSNRSHHGAVGLVAQNHSAADNASNSNPCTINIREATIERWYTSEFIWPTYYFASMVIDSTLTYSVQTQGEFNVTTALSWALGLAVVTTMSWNTDMSTSLIEFIPTTLPGPIAATTEVLTVNLFSPLPSGPLTKPDLVDSLDLHIVTPPSATITGPSNTQYVAPSGTPFVYFTEYEVERSEPMTDALGNVYYTHSTMTSNFSSPLAFDYSGDSLESSSTATGIIPSNFVAQIPESTCVPGTYTGSVTVLIVVNVIYAYVGKGNMVHIESSVGAIGLPGFPKMRSKAYVETSASVEAPEPQPSAAASVNPGLTEANPTQAPTADSGNGVPQNGGPGAQTAAQPGQNGLGSDSRPPVVVIGGSSFTMGSSSAFVIGQQTLAPGGPAIAVGGTTVSLAPSATAVVVNGATTPLSDVQQAAPNPPVITIGSSAYTANAATQYYLGPGQTLKPGGAASVDGTVVSLGPSASYVVVGGSTQAFPAAMITAAPANPGVGPFVVGGQTLAPGGKVVLGGTTISLDSMGSNLVINGYSKAVGGAAAANQPLITVAGSNYAAADGTSFVVAGQTITPGGRIVVSGTTLSLDASVKSIYVNGVPTAIPTNYPFSTLYPALTFQGTSITPQAASAGAQPAYVIGGATLTPGGRIVVSGTTLSLAPFATALLVNGATSTLNPAVLTSLPAIPFGSTSLSPILGPGRSYVIDGQTLTPGGRITVSGTTLSLLPTPTAVVINGATYALSPSTPNSAAASASTNAPLLTLGGRTYTALPGSSGAQPTYVIGSQTLTAGGSIVLAGGTTVSLAPQATALVVNGATTVLFPATATGSATLGNRLAELTIGGSTYTALAAGGAAGPTFVINGVTLTPGGTVVLGPGTTVVLQSANGGAAVAVVAGVTTETFAGASQTGSGGSAVATAAGGEGVKETGKGKGKKNTAALTGVDGIWMAIFGLWGFMGVVFWMF